MGLFDDLLARLLPGIQSFRLQRRFDRAMTMASTVEDLDDRVNWCNRAFQMAEALDPWPLQTPSRDFAIGSVYAMRGQAYLELRARDYKIFSRLAVADLEVGARLLTPADGMYWSQLMNILSMAYCESVDGNPGDNRERAIQTAEAALSAIDPLQERGIWLEIAHNLAGYYDERMYGVPRANHQKALSILRRAQSMVSIEFDALEWAIVTSSLGLAYHKCNGNDGDDNEAAIDLIESALPVLSRDAPLHQWAGAMINLSACYASRIKGDSIRNVERAIYALEQALGALTREQTPTTWAMVQMNLGGLWAQREDGDTTNNIEFAILAFENALTVYTPKIFPVEHAQVLLSLSQAHESLTVGPKLVHTELAIEQARKALASVSKETAPRVWAEASLRLGNALRARRGGDRRENIKNAIAAFETALDALDAKSDPELWSTAKSSLANALAENVTGNPVENLEQSILHQQEALEVLRPVTSRREWANAMRNLAISFGERVLGSRADNTERAIALAELGLVVLNSHDHATQRSELLEIIGEGFESRIRGERMENLHRAVEAYDDAWETRSRSENPEAWLRLRQRRLKATKLLHDVYVRTPQSAVPEWLRIPLSVRMGTLKEADPQEFLAAMREAASSVSAEDYPRTWTNAQEGLAQAQQMISMSHDAESAEFLTEQMANARESLKIHEGMLAVNPKEIRPQVWARTRSLMASDYQLLHMLEDLRHRGPNGLADRAKVELPNRSDEAMRFLALAAMALEDVLSVHTTEYDPREYLKTAVKLGSCHIWRRDWEAATAGFALAGIAADRLLADVETSESEMRDTLRALGDLSTAGSFVEIINGRLLRSLDLLEVGRARLLAKSLKLASLPLLDDERNELNELLREISIRERRLAGPNLIDRTTPLDEAIRLRHRFREVLSRLDSSVISPTVDAKQLLTEVTSEGVVLVVPVLSDAGGRLLLGYSLGGHATLEVAETESVITLEGIFQVRVREGLPGWLGAYKDFVDFPDLDRWSQVLQATGDSLGDLLTEPIRRTLNAPELKCTRLDILPQGPLGLLPLNLASDPTTGAALIDRFEVSFSPSLTALAHVRRRSRQALVPRTISVVLHSDGSSERELHYTPVEVDLVTSWFDESAFVVKDGRDTHKGTALESFRGQDIWHFACHGKFDLNVPLHSRLGPFNGEWLTLEELFDARGLGNPQLVILSACSTGLYDTRELPGEFIGLPNAFLQLGAAAVVATLWPIDDIATALLMGRFYEEYLGNEKPSCSALRAAQLWLRDAGVDELRRVVEGWVNEKRLKGKNAKRVEQDLERWADWQTAPFAQPAYWAGFVHFGA